MRKLCVCHTCLSKNFCLHIYQILWHHRVSVSHKFWAELEREKYCKMQCFKKFVIKLIKQIVNNTWAWDRSWCLKGWWSWAAIRHRKGDIHGNYASGHYQRRHHTKPVSRILVNLTLTKGMADRGKNRQVGLITRRTAIKRMRMQAMRNPQQRVQRSYQG